MAVAVAIIPACGRSEVLPLPLAVETAWLAGVDAPPGWRPYVRTLGEGQSVRSIDGVSIALAGEIESGSLRATSAGTAWESPDLRFLDSRGECNAAMAFVDRAGASSSFGATACADALNDPALQVDFVLSFWSEVAPTRQGSRSFGAGALLHPDGTRTIVVSLSTTLTP